MLIGHLIGHLVGQTKAGQFFGTAMIVVFAVALPIVSVLGFSALAWNAIAKESSYRQHFGVDWKAQFEKDQGPLNIERMGRNSRGGSQCRFGNLVLPDAYPRPAR